MLKNFRTIQFLILTITLLATNLASAADHQARLWLGFNHKQNFTQDPQKFWTFFTQVRLGENPLLRTYILETSVGNQFVPSASFSLGYRWIANLPWSNFNQDNRLFEQLNWQLNDLKSNKKIVSRTRFEQTHNSQTQNVVARLRERMMLEFINENSAIRPLFYEELFMNVSELIGPMARFPENRVFVGFNYYPQSKHEFWEVGYILQNQWRRVGPTLTNHIFTVMYNQNF